MYSFRCASFMFARRCPLNQMTSVTSYSYSHLMMRKSAEVITSPREKSLIQDEFSKRNYVSVDGRKNKGFNPKDFNLKNLDVKSSINQIKQIFQEVQLGELANAPLPAFWFGIGGLIPFVFPTVSCMLFGYSPFLIGAQHIFSATVCSSLGGVKYGFMMQDKAQMTWESLGLSVAPHLLGWLSLMLPQTLGLVLVGGVLLGTTFTDLSTTSYPAWFKAMRLGFTIPAVFFLLLSAIMSLFH